MKILPSLALAASLSLGLLLGCQPPPAPSPIPMRTSSGSSLTTGATPAGRPAKKTAPNDTGKAAEAAKKIEERKEAVEASAAAAGILQVSLPKKGAWNQWGGSSLRNNTPDSTAVFTGFLPGGFDRKTGAWKKDKSKNIKWVSSLGSQSYGNPVVSGGKVLVGTNNYFGYLKRYPYEVDLGCLLCFDEKNGKFLWQHSSEKLDTGRVNDWPLMGICCAPLIEGDRAWFVTSRGEVRCLDLQGFYDGEDDGPVKNDPAKMFSLLKAEDAAAQSKPKGD